MTTSYQQQIAELAEACALKLKFEDAGFRVREIIPPATDLFDPMLGWVDDDSSLVFCDIGGQAKEPGWDPHEGHGSIWRLHRNDHLEAIVPRGAIGKGMIMFPMKSSASFGEYSSQLFFLGQLKPGRAGAHNTHAVYWVPPGWDTPEVFCTVPHTGSIGKGISGALCPAGWGEDGSPEEGMFFVVSLLNCVLYKITPDRQITPWLICDEDHVGHQFMPTTLFRASQDWGDDAGALIVAGRPNTSFERPAELSGQLQTGFWRIDDPHTSPRLTRVPGPADPRVADLAIIRRVEGPYAPEGFGAFAGQRFACLPGSANLAHTTMLDSIPYDASIVRYDADGEVHPFATQLQSGAPALLFQGDRMIVSIVRKSYSTGDYHLPDGSIYEITYVG